MPKGYGNSPFAYLEKSHHQDGEEFVDGHVVNCDGEVMVKIGAYWYTEAEAAIERQSRHDYCQARRDERAESAQRAAEQRRADEESFRYLMRNAPGSTYGYNEPTRKTTKTYKQEDTLGEVATTIGYWVFALLIFVGCVVGVMSSF